jgi:hypothetical protein
MDRKFPIMMLAAYTNLPEDFDRDASGFQSLLERIEIRGRHGVTFKSPPQDTPALTPPPATAAAAPPSPPPAPAPPAPPAVAAAAPAPHPAEAAHPADAPQP